MLFVQYLFSLLNGPILAFREEGSTLKNINKAAMMVRHVRMEDY